MNKEHLQLLLTILLELKADVLKLHKNEPINYNLLNIAGICTFIANYLDLNDHVIPQIIYIFKSICGIWPNCRIDVEGNKDTTNCVAPYERYYDEFLNKTQWTNLRRLELLEFSIKYLQEKLNEEVMESN